MGSTSQQYESAQAARDSVRGGDKSLEKSPAAFRTISEVANELDVPQHVLRFWESKFSQIKPMKRGGGRRYYRPEDIGLLRSIRNLLYSDGYTIKGVQRLLREGGVKSLMGNLHRSGLAKPPSAAAHPPLGKSRSLSPNDRHALEGLLDELESMRVLLVQARSAKL